MIEGEPALGEALGEGRCRVLVVEDDVHLLRSVLQFLPELNERLVVDGVETGEEAAELIATYRACFPWQVLIVDVFLPDGHGTDLLSALASIDARPAVILWTGMWDPTLDEQLRAHLYEPPDGKETFDFLRTAIVNKGESNLPARLLSTIVRVAPEAWIDDKVAAAGARHRLTEAELDVVKRRLRGQSSKDIVSSRGGSYRTVEKHFDHAMRKLGCSGRTALQRRLHAWPLHLPSEEPGRARADSRPSWAPALPRRPARAAGGRGPDGSGRTR